jgi:ABC-type lipoprotein export system ATPase subunit
MSDQQQQHDPNDIIVGENLVKIYKTQDIEAVALQGLDITVTKGELMAIIGNSGSGKSSLLNLIGGLDRPSAGSLLVDGKNLLKFTDQQLIEYRRDTIGFVWQNSARNLIPYLTALENIELPMLLTGKARRKRALELIDMVGLYDRRANTLDRLSGGEQQRIAIAIGLANNPKILLADEPTGSVDSETTQLIMDVFRRFNEVYGVTIIIVTHDQELSKNVDRVAAIRDGRTSSELIRRHVNRDELKEAGSLAESDDTPDDDSHDEFLVLDRVGRLQLPEDFIKELRFGKNKRVKAEMVDGRIILTNPDPVDE